MLQTQMLLGWGLGAMRPGTSRLSKVRMRTGRPGTGDDKENEIVLKNIQE
jgi:hypothetical protein